MEGGESESPRHFIDIRDHDGATLRRMLEVELFPELWHLRTTL